MALRIRTGREPAGKSEREMVLADLLRGHLADRHPGRPRPACRDHPRPLGDRGPAALGPRPGLRRGSLADPHRRRSRIVASLRNLVITILRLAEAQNIAAACVTHAASPAPSPDDYELLNGF